MRNRNGSRLVFAESGEECPPRLLQFALSGRLRAFVSVLGILFQFLTGQRAG